MLLYPCTLAEVARMCDFNPDRSAIDSLLAAQGLSLLFQVLLRSLDEIDGRSRPVSREASPEQIIGMAAIALKQGKISRSQYERIMDAILSEEVDTARRARRAYIEPFGYLSDEN